MANAMTPVQDEMATVQVASRDAGEADFPLDKYRRWFNAYEANKQEELNEQQIARRYYHAKQWTAKEIATLKRRGQAPIFDNRIARKIDFLVGIEQRMRRDPKAYPRTPNEERSADVATAGLRYCCDRVRWESVASEATNDGLIDGIGVVFVGIEQNRTGLDPIIKPVQRDRFFYDPRSIRPDFADARYLGLHLWMDVDEAKERWPDQAEQIDKLLDSSTSIGAINWTEQNYATAWADFENRRVRIVEFWEKTPQGWRFCNFSGEVKLDGGMSPYVDEEGTPDCPYVAWSPYVDEQGNRYGPIRNMKPMQDEINHRRSKFLHLLSSKQLYIRKGTIDDVDELRRQINRPDGIIEHDGDWGKETGIVDHTQDIRGQSELLAQSQSSLENLGPNPGLIGKGGGVADQSGRAILAQRDSGMTELSPVFERNRDWKLRVYRKLWARIKQAWTAEKWIRITDEDDAPQFIGINQYETDPMTGQIIADNVIADIDVDIIMDEGPDTVTMNEELLQTLSQLGAGAVPPKVLIEISNAPNKERLFKLIDEATAPNPQVAEMQARMAKLEEMLAAADVDKSIAETENKRADAISKLVTAFKPDQMQIDQFGNPVSLPAPTNLNAALAAMQAFPVQYGQPTVAQMAMMEASQPPQPEPEMPEGPGAMMPPQGGPPPGLAPDMGMQPEMPGGLPVQSSEMTVV
jgi:hypothetical protein